MPKPIIKIPKLPILGRKLLAEFFGTYILVYVISQVNDTTNQLAQGGIAVGFCLASLIFTFGHHSFAHFNPAVSFAWFLLGFLNKVEFLTYFIIQILGGLCGALTVFAMLGGSGFPVVKPADDSSPAIGRMFFVEFIATALLATTVTQVAASKQRGNHFFGLAIGTVVLSQAYAAGKMSGASFNPAVTTGLQLTKCFAGECSHLKYWPLYLVAELSGGIIAFLFFCLSGSYHAEDEKEWLNEEYSSSSDAADTEQPLVTHRVLTQEEEEVENKGVKKL